MSLNIPVSYFLHERSGSKDLIILLHGYRDSGPAFLQRIFSSDLPKWSILAPNAPFPVPVKEEAGYREAYSWYFTDARTEKILIPPSVSIAYLKNLLINLGLANHRKIIIGFSQGGFFAPILSKSLNHVLKIIGLGCIYPYQDYQETPVEDVDAIHGDQDEVIDSEKAKESFQKIRSHLKRGMFFSVKGLSHGWNEEAGRILLERIEAGFIGK